MHNVKLTIAYDGTNYHGFQEQRGTGLITIQEVLSQVLGQLAGQKIRVIGAARTDAGVHARGQVVNFDASGLKIPVTRLPLVLNSSLPDDIVVLDAEEVPETFHARFHARAKTYSYTVYNSRVPSPFWRLYSYFVPQPLDLEAMAKGARLLEGEHDFKSFQASGSLVKSTVRTLFKIELKRKKELIYLTFRGNGFLYNMVRIMVGTLLDVALGKREPEEIQAILEARDRKMAGRTVPASGLCLEKVEY